MLDARTTIDWTRELADQLDWHWTGFVRPKLEGLTDEELHWEPVPGCWGVRRREEIAEPVGSLTSAWLADIAFPAPEPPPVTTIAWRLAHLTVGCFGARAASHFDGPAIDYFTYDYCATAAQTLADLDQNYDRWMSGLRALSADDLERQVGDAEGPWASHPMGGLVLHISREAIHHGAECLLLRDLFRAGGGTRLGA